MVHSQKHNEKKLTQAKTWPKDNTDTERKREGGAWTSGARVRTSCSSPKNEEQQLL